MVLKCLVIFYLLAHNFKVHTFVLLVNICTYYKSVIIIFLITCEMIVIVIESSALLFSINKKVGKG